MAVLLAIAGVLIVATVWLASRSPYRAAEDGVQLEGRARLRDILRRVAATEWGVSGRGRLLGQTLTSLLDRNRIVYTRELLDERARFYPDWTGRRNSDAVSGTVYVDARLVEIRDDYGLAKVLFHEAVHALRPRTASIEEECDAYVAGVTAADALAARPTPWVVRVDGASLAEFVSKQYPELERAAEYAPVGQSRAWLEERSELTAVVGR